MNDAMVILVSFMCLILSLMAVSVATSRKGLVHSIEYKVGISGAVVFMYISWIIVYIANIHPFVKPEFVKTKKPDYYRA